jgi:hypothetical protein
MMRRRYELTDKEWSIIEPLLPNKPRGVRQSSEQRMDSRANTCKERQSRSDRTPDGRGNDGSARRRLGIFPLVNLQNPATTECLLVCSGAIIRDRSMASVC